jgi:hypothetical protein
LTHDEDKQMAALLQKNYALESLPFINDMEGNVGAFLRLNGEGRRYLVQDGTSVSKGIEVLSRLNNDINCKPVHTKARSPAGDSRSFNSTGQK